MARSFTCSAKSALVFMAEIASSGVETDESMLSARSCSSPPPSPFPASCESLAPTSLPLATSLEAKALPASSREVPRLREEPEPPEPALLPETRIVAMPYLTACIHCEHVAASGRESMYLEQFSVSGRCRSTRKQCWWPLRSFFGSEHEAFSHGAVAMTSPPSFLRIVSFVLVSSANTGWKAPLPFHWICMLPARPASSPSTASASASAAPGAAPPSASPSFSRHSSNATQSPQPSFQTMVSPVTAPLATSAPNAASEGATSASCTPSE